MDLIGCPATSISYRRHVSFEDTEANGIFSRLLKCEGGDLCLGNGRGGRPMPWWFPVYDRRIPPRIAEIDHAGLYPDGSFQFDDKFAYLDFLFVPQTVDISVSWTATAQFVEALAPDGRFKLKELPIRRIPGTALSLQSPHAGNFGHFLFDVLPRSIYYDKFADSIDSIIVSRPRFPIQRILLERLFPNAKFIEQGQEIIEADKFLIPANPCQSFGYCPEALDHLRCRLQTEIFSYFGIKRRNSGDIFVSRRDGRAGTNRDVIANSDDMEDAAIRCGYSVVQTSRLDPIEQLELFANAQSIAGVHGAGLLNMMFMDSDARYLEISLPPAPHWAYRFAARYVREPSLVLCEMEGEQAICPIPELEAELQKR